ncbi:DNA-binding response regulator [Bordetella avium]|uniref:response regulator transcription factor n=1 Tax=Bordetella avium TaxID=521 RepID=UPI000FDA3565|nr:response regulator transcription factor [Bordetella avium]AZY50943.1 DNA-binding response regulator [Bordetella avium]
MLSVDGLLRIGLLEDDEDFREELTLGLEGYGFKVVFGRGDSASFQEALQSQRCDIVIIDANVPGEDGFSVATRLRAHSHLGIVMLTGRGAMEDRVRGLEGGADVYLTKPVDLLELSSVIRSLARRMRLARPAAAETAPVPPLRQAGQQWSLLDGGWVLACPDGGALHLNAQERAFLMTLMQSAGEAVTRQVLAEIIQPHNPAEFEPRRVDVMVSRLRAKAQSAGFKLPVLSVRGQGYVFVA